MILRFFTPLILVGVLIVMNGSLADALDRDSFQYEPPVLTKQSVLDHVAVELPASDIKRARVLVAQENGYQALNLDHKGEAFGVSIPFGELAELTYHFQIETKAGHIFESKRYVVRKPSSDEFEKTIAEKEAALEKQRQQVVQLENNVQGLRSADPKVLAKQKNVELARAMVLLSKRERQVQEAEAALRTGRRQEVQP